MTPDEIKANVDAYFRIVWNYEKRTPENVFLEINERMTHLGMCGLDNEVFQDIFKKWNELCAMSVLSLISDSNVECKHQRDLMVQILESLLLEVKGG